MTDNQLHDALNVSLVTGGGFSVLAFVTLTEWLAIGGFVLALVGLIVNVWHKRQMVKLAREKLELERSKGG